MRLIAILLLINSPSFVAAEDIPPEQIRSAVKRIIPWLEKGAAGSSKENKCFTCHNHALPILALCEAKQHGFSIDDQNLRQQLEHTLAHLKRGEQKYSEGKGQGGQVLTAGYAVWALHKGGIESNGTTTAVVNYVLKHQQKKNHWTKSGRRPPSDGGEFTATFVALKALRHFGSDEQAEAKKVRQDAAQAWVVRAEVKDTEDAVFRLKALGLLGLEDEVRAASDELLSQQRPDGGWSQLPDMESDAYATASVMATLLQEGEQKPTGEAIKRGLTYLLQSQLADGTWRVSTRADGFQPYYESGFPHEQDQFISIAASSWATLALLRSLPGTYGANEKVKAK